MFVLDTSEHQVKKGRGSRLCAPETGAHSITAAATATPAAWS
jgi:hypothetical protein